MSGPPQPFYASVHTLYGNRHYPNTPTPRIYLSGDILDDLGRPSHVRVRYHRRSGCLLVQPCGPDEPQARKLSSPTSRPASSRYCAIGKLCSRFGLRPKDGPVTYRGTFSGVAVLGPLALADAQEAA